MQPPLLEVRNLTKIYGEGLLRKEQTVALEDFSLAVLADSPRITTIAGESGSGKTTLANLILRFLSPTTGEVLYRGKNIVAMSRKELFDLRREIQAIFQNPFEVYNPFYKVDHVFSFAIRKFNLARNSSEARRITEEALEIVGLRPEEILGKYPHELSGGQRQRIMVARAFLLKPRLIVADEPVSMIDASLQVRILDIFERLKSEFGISFLYITHDLSTAYQISDDIYILYLGSVMEKGDIEAVMQDPQHPYTQLLVSSIPVPDPSVRWVGRLELPPEIEGQVRVIGRCKYVDRCEHAWSGCQEAPPLVQVGDNHWVACGRHVSPPS